MANNTAYTQNNGPDVVKPTQVATGRITMPATSITTTDFLLQNLGFTPRYIRFWNVTDRICIEWFAGMTANTCLKTAANGAQTLETSNGGITVCDADGTANTAGNSFKVLQNATLAVVVASVVLTYRAEG